MSLYNILKPNAYDLHADNATIADTVLTGSVSIDTATSGDAVTLHAEAVESYVIVLPSTPPTRSGDVMANIADGVTRWTQSAGSVAIPYTLNQFTGNVPANKDVFYSFNTQGEDIPGLFSLPRGVYRVEFVQELVKQSAGSNFFNFMYQPLGSNMSPILGGRFPIKSSQFSTNENASVRDNVTFYINCVSDCPNFDFQWRATTNDGAIVDNWSGYMSMIITRISDYNP